MRQYIRHARERYWHIVGLFNGEPERNVDIYLLYHCGQFTQDEIAGLYGLCHTTVGRIVHKGKQ